MGREGGNTGTPTMPMSRAGERRFLTLGHYYFHCLEKPGELDIEKINKLRYKLELLLRSKINV